MTLYEIDQRLLSLVDPETGELMDFDEFQQLQMERSEKIEGVILWYKDLLAQAKAIKEEVEQLTKRRQAAEHRAEGLLGWIALALNGEKFSTPRCAVSYRQTSSVDVVNEDALIQWANSNGMTHCLRYKKPEISKREVADCIKMGIDVPGASIKYEKKARVN